MNLQSAESQPVIETLNSHVSIRQYSRRSIPDEMLSTILNSARRSPTSSNMQAYSIIVVKQNQTKKTLAHLAGDQKHIETCDTFLAICADISRLELACAMHGTELVKNLENTLVSTIDAALVGMSIATAAESFGLGHVMIGGIRNNPKKVAEVLDLPDGAYVVYGMCLGWPDEDRIPTQKPRMPESVMIHHESYNHEIGSSELEAYDRELADYYRSQGRNTPDAAWTGNISRKFSQPRREHLRGELEDLGFRFG